METDDYLRALRADGDALLAAAHRGPDADVPGCPGWSVADLLTHTGRVHRWAGGVVATRADRRPEGFPPRPPQDELFEWYAAGLDDLLDTLAATPAETPVWSWGHDQRAAFWHRRMALETVVHRWDGESARGRPAPIAPDVAVDAIDEVLDVVLRRFVEDGTRSPVGTLHVHTTDAPGEWLVSADGAGALVVERRHAKGDLAVRGPAADLVLLLYGRMPLDALECFGDTAAWEAWQPSP